MKGATLSGEFVEMFYKKGDVLQSQSLCKIIYMYVCTCRCVCVYMYTCMGQM